MIKLMHGDCIEKMKSIPDGSVDLVLTDPPYGIVKGMKLRNTRDYYQWDNVIDIDDMFDEISRVLRYNGRCLLFCQEPFTSKLVLKKDNYIRFNQKLIWIKNSFANYLNARRCCVSYYEEMLLFTNKNKKLKEDIKAIFNLPDGSKSKSNVFEYAKESKSYHSTQKPVALLDDLIRTYSNEGDTVLDFTMGSGSTGVACVNNGRSFIGIELNDNYFDVACTRIKKAAADKTPGQGAKKPGRGATPTQPTGEPGGLGLFPPRLEIF